MNPKISIIIPNFNLAPYLGRALQSVIDQPYTEKEIIVVDGGSTDGSIDVIKKYFDHIDHLVIETDDGQADALNKGFRKATGDVLCWLNSDDGLLPNALEAVGQIFRDNSEIHWIVGNTTLMTENDLVMRSSPSRSHSRIRFLSGDFRWVQQESTFWSRQLWDVSGAKIDDSYKLALDLELWLRFFEHARLYPVEAALGSFRIRRGQRSEVQLGAYLAEVERAIRSNREKLSPAYKSYFQAALDAPLDVSKPANIAALGPRVAAEDVKLLNFDHASQRFNNQNTQNFSPHLKKRPPVTPSSSDDVIQKVAPDAFLLQRFTTKGDDLSRFANVHAGEQCVIVGNGPSLNKMDHSVLENANVFAANSIFLLFDRVKWRPKYYSCVDTRVLPDIAPDIEAMRRANPDITCFFPSELHVYDGTGRTVDTRKLLAPCPRTYFFRQAYVDRGQLPGGAFSLDLNAHAYVPNTVTITLMQIAAYMGFSEMVLVGCDTSYSIPPTVVQSGPDVGSTGKLLLTSTEDDDPNHFDPSYFGKGRAWHNPKVEDMIWHYQQAEKVLREKGTRVVNATVGGNLEVFERADYRDIIKPKHT